MPLITPYIPVCLQIFGPKSGEILWLTPLNRVNFRETAFRCHYSSENVGGSDGGKFCLGCPPRALWAVFYKILS